ncbi:mitochondrial protein Pet127-domain-containing protein [Chaetomium tenue]|uniref:Mitochondrial protein Pet127-domain-containing protein n=1 Tax=Chaetomium tenue TaxID=1854479 RepID=A0ACB7PII3_9PEZI|nr:mitochondrial protein Pet127-domain-containing protein [Chaetomium globosum]
MLRLVSQGRSALRTHFICLSCRALLASGATRLPSAVAKICAARHYSSPSTIDQPAQPSELSQESGATEKEAENGPEKRRRKRVERQAKGDSGKETKKDYRKRSNKDSEKPTTPRSKAKYSKSTRPSKSTSSALTPSSDSPAARRQIWLETLNVLKDIKDSRRSPSQTRHELAAEVEEIQKSPGRDRRLEGVLHLLKQVLRQELGDATPGLPHVPIESPPIDAPQEKKPARLGKTLKEALGIGRPKGDEEVAEEAVPEERSSGKATRRAPKPKAASSSPQKASKAGPKAKVSSLRAGTKTSGKKSPDFVVNRIDANKIDLTPVEKEQPPVPSLAYGLDRVLFNPGVYHIQDPRSRVFNFDPYLERIMPIKEFDFDAIKQYVTSSKDNVLIETAAEHQKKYTGSTSSMTSTLAHFHFLLSSWRPINPAMVSKDFEIDSYRFTRIMRAPAATFLHWKDGTYAIDADKEFDTANVLSMLGKSMEKFLTLPKEEFEKYRRTNSDQLTEEERNGPESYHYTTLGDFMMRSQLDAYDPRLPGTGMFDLKTRAVVSIRMDARDPYKGMGYEIRSRFGQWESFEREYYDMIRSAFLKYSLQVRMGRMDGIFVAYHNTERIFGFQYIPLPEMDLSLHGQEDTTLGDREFKLSLHLLNKVLDKAAAKYPGRSLRLHFETRGDNTPFMYIFAKPVTPAEIEEIQGATQAKVEEFEREMMGIVGGSRALGAEEDGEEAVDEADEHDIDEAGAEQISTSPAWTEVRRKVEDELEDEEHGTTFVREAIEDALQESGLLRTTAPDETQRYVDAFLEAMTSNTRRVAPEAQESSELADSVEETDAASVGASKAAEPSEELDEESGEEPEEDGQTPATEDSSADEPTLKDLIVKLAAEIRTIPSRRRASEDEDIIYEDEPKNAASRRKVEKIFLELTEQPQGEDKVEEGVGNGVIETGTVVVQPGEQVEPTETETAETAEPVESTEAAESAPEAGETLAAASEDSVTPEPTTETSATPSEDATPSSAEAEAEAETETDVEAEAEADSEIPGETQAKNKELYGLILTIRNKVDGKYVERPENLTAKQKWQVEYAIEEVKPARAQNLYEMVLKRRKNLLYPEQGDQRDRWYDMFRGSLDRYSTTGRRFRRDEDRRQRGQPVHVYGSLEPLPYEQVFGAAREEAENGYEDVDEGVDENGYEDVNEDGPKKE